MKLKYYIRGIGIGIVAATIIFAVGYAVVSANQKAMATGKEEQTTQESVLAYTQKETSKETEQETSKVQAETTKAEVSQTTEAVTEAASTQGVTESTTVMETVQKTQAPTKEVEYLDNDTAQIEIGRGYTATQVADMLYEAGIIDDRDGFIKYMVDTGSSVKMITGTHIVTKGDSFENIAEAITIK